MKTWLAVKRRFESDSERAMLSGQWLCFPNPI